MSTYLLIGIPRQRFNTLEIFKDIFEIPARLLDQCNTFLLEQSMLGWEQPTSTLISEF
jgi:hypothetical protein